MDCKELFIYTQNCFPRISLKIAQYMNLDIHYNCAKYEVAFAFQISCNNAIYLRKMLALPRVIYYFFSDKRNSIVSIFSKITQYTYLNIHYICTLNKVPFLIKFQNNEANITKRSKSCTHKQIVNYKNSIGRIIFKIIQFVHLGVYFLTIHKLRWHFAF